MIDFRDFIKNVEAAVIKHPNEGTDLINILYTINKLPKTYNERAKYVKLLQSNQNPQTGLFKENGKDSLNSTARYTSVLYLIDSYPRYRFTNILGYKDHDLLYGFMNNHSWNTDPGKTMQNISAIYAALVINGDADYAWQEKYFNWLWNNTDGDTGLIRKGFINYLKISPLNYLNGMFYYICSLEYSRMPIRYPSRLIDTCIQVYELNKKYDFGENISLNELSWIYCLSHAMRQTDYRYKDCIECLRNLETVYTSYLLSFDFSTEKIFDDLHMLLIALSAIAEMQSVLPGTILTETPLHSVLSKYPFI